MSSQRINCLFSACCYQRWQTKLSFLAIPTVPNELNRCNTCAVLPMSQRWTRQYWLMYRQEIFLPMSPRWSRQYWQMSHLCCLTYAPPGGLDNTDGCRQELFLPISPRWTRQYWQMYRQELFFGGLIFILDGLHSVDKQTALFSPACMLCLNHGKNCGWSILWFI